MFSLCLIHRHLVTGDEVNCRGRLEETGLIFYKSLDSIKIKEIKTENLKERLKSDNPSIQT